MEISEAAKKYPIITEDMEPATQRVIGALGMRCEAVKGDRQQVLATCVSLWWAVRGFDHIAIAIRSACGYDNSNAMYYSIAMNNRRAAIGQYIKGLCGEDPETSGYFKSSSL